MAAPSSPQPLPNPGTTANCIEMVQYTRFGTLATTTLLAWDILTTLDQEIRHIWRLRWCYSKFQFLGLRYGTLLLFLYQSLMIISPIPSSVCRIATTFNAAFSSVIMVAVTSVLMSRTWALYDRSRTVMYIILCTYVAVFTPAIVVMMTPDSNFFANLKEFEDVKQAAGSNGDVAWLLGGCYISGWSTGFVVLFVSLLAYETGLFAATAYKLWSVRSSASLVGHLFRDGTVYYLIMLGSLIGGAVGSSSMASTGSRAFVASGYFVGLKVVACSHMVLQLRTYLTTSEAYVEGVLRSIDDGRTQDEINTEVRFADPRVLSDDEDKEEFELETRRDSFDWEGKAQWIRSDDDHAHSEGSRSPDPVDLPSFPSATYSPSSPRRPLSSRRPSTKRSTGSITMTRFGVWDEWGLPLEDDEDDDRSASASARVPESPV